MNHIREILQLPASFFPMDRWIHWSGQKVFCPFYHTVSNRRLPYIAPHYRVRNEKEFEADLDFLLKHFSPVDWKELLAIVNGKSVVKPVFFLSFDDGLRQVYEVVAPILLRKGVPATFFINPNFIQHKTWMFRYKAALLLEKFQQRPVQTLSRAQILSTTSAEELNVLAEMLQLDFEEEWNRWQPYLTVEDLKHLHQHGFSIASHSVGHPQFSSLNNKEQWQNIRSSFEMMQAMDLDPSPLFAFPFTDAGVRKEFFEGCYDELSLQLTFGTAGLKRDVDPRHVQRFPVENYEAPLYRSAAAEYFYYLLKQPLGKNRIARH